MNGAQVRDLEGAVCDEVLTLHCTRMDGQTDGQICEIYSAILQNLTKPGL